MNLHDAEAVRKMIDGHWNLRMNDETAELWLSVLISEDAAEATAVVAHMAKKLHYPPKIVDFKEVLRMLYPPARPEPFDGDALPEGKRGVAAPDWVWVWSWVRWHRDPREERPFPQQSGHVDATETMTQAEYEDLLAEWQEAGSPKDKSPLPVALR